MKTAKKILKQKINEKPFMASGIEDGTILEFKDRIISKKDIEDLGSLIHDVFAHEQISLVKSKEVEDSLKFTGTGIGYFPQDQKDLKDVGVMACVTREWRNQYRIFIHEDTSTGAFPALDLHEKGHILYNHIDGQKQYLDQFSNLLEKLDELKLLKYFEADALKESREDVYKMLFHEFSNIAQDMEVNSKLFLKREWENVKLLLMKSQLLMEYRKISEKIDSFGIYKDKSDGVFGSDGQQEMVKIFEYIVNSILLKVDEDIDFISFCHPENNGWPHELDWMTYMIMLVKNFDDTMEQVSDNLQKGKSGSGQGRGQGKSKKDNKSKSKNQDDNNEDSGEGSGDSDGESDGESDNQKDDKNGGQNKDGKEGSDKDNKDDKSQGSGKDDEKDDEKDDKEGSGKTEKFSKKDVSDYLDKKEKEENAKEKANKNALVNEDDSQKDKNGQKKGDDASNSQIFFEKCETFEDFSKFLQKNCMGKKNRRMNSDVLYNSNRGKFSSNVVVPRRHLIEKWVPTEVYIIVDVSGSVNEDFVNKIISGIISNNSGIDLKKSRIIFCDTSVTGDTTLDQFSGKIQSGGGTEIANGIKYVNEKKYLKKKTDKLFIISDFEDNLDRWLDAAKKMPGQKFAIGYDLYGSSAEQIFKSWFRGNSSEWNSTFKTVFLTK